MFDIDKINRNLVKNMDIDFKESLEEDYEDDFEDFDGGWDFGDEYFDEYVLRYLKWAELDPQEFFDEVGSWENIPSISKEDNRLLAFYLTFSDGLVRWDDEDCNGGGEVEFLADDGFEFESPQELMEIVKYDLEEIFKELEETEPDF